MPKVALQFYLKEVRHDDNCTSSYIYVVQNNIPAILNPNGLIEAKAIK